MFIVNHISGCSKVLIKANPGIGIVIGPPITKITKISMGPALSYDRVVCCLSNTRKGNYLLAVILLECEWGNLRTYEGSTA